MLNKKKKTIKQPPIPKSNTEELLSQILENQNRTGAERNSLASNHFESSVHGNKLRENLFEATIRGNEELEKANDTLKEISEKMVPQEIEEDKMFIVKGKKGDKGDKGDDGHTPTEEELLDLINPLIPEAIPGHTPTTEELMELITPLIPEVENGETPSDERLIELITPLIPSRAEDGRTPTKAELLAIIKPLLPKIEDLKPKPLTSGDLIKMLQGKLSYSDLKDTPNLDTFRRQSSKTVSLSELDDVDLSGLMRDSQGKYVLGSGGGGGSSVWGGITGTLSDQTDLQTALNAKANIADLGAVAFSNDYNSLDNLPTIPTGTIDGTLTTNELVYSVDANTVGSLAVATYPSLTEISYVKGVTSAIQTQLNAKGDVSKVGTPVNKQIGVWTGDGTLEGLADFTYENLSGGGQGGELTIGEENTISYIKARNATTANTWGGTLNMSGGNGNGTGRGGSFSLRGGTGGSGDGGHGGGVAVYAANAIGTGNADGGDVTFYTGAGKGTGRDGRYLFEIPGDRAMIWDLSNLDDFYDYVFPNGGGTFAMTSDISALSSVYQPLDTQLTSVSGLSYTGNALKVVRVNAGETGFELATVSGGGTIDGSGTANELTYWVDSDTIGSLAVATYPSLTEISYVKGLTSAAQTQITARELLTNKATDFTTLNNTLYPTTQAVADYVTNAVVGLLDYRGSYDASTNLFPATGGSGIAGAVLKGDFWICSVTGTLGGVVVTPGDLIISLTDVPGQTSTNWDLISNELGYTPANNALSNLGTVAINTSLISDTNNTDDLGSTGVRWKKTWTVDLESTNMPTVNGTSLSSTFQPLDADLTTIAGLTATTDNFIVSVASAWASRTPSQVRTTLGLVIGTNVQAWDADLDTWATKTAPSGTVLGTTDAQTVTSKRIQPRTASSTTSSNLSPDLSTANVYYRTTQTATLTIDAPTGTPVIGETIMIYVDSAGSQTLTINGTYVPFGAAFPATTTAGKTFMMSCQYNGTNWKTLWANAI